MNVLRMDTSKLVIYQEILAFATIAFLEMIVSVSVDYKNHLVTWMIVARCPVPVGPPHLTFSLTSVCNIHPHACHMLRVHSLVYYPKIIWLKVQTIMQSDSSHITSSPITP